MTSELKKCLTVLFRHKGKDLLSEREFVYAVSMDLHWFSPKEAQKLLDIVTQKELLRLSHGMLAPTFELSEHTVQIDYKPSKELLGTPIKSKKDNLFMDLVEKISFESKLSKREIVSRINKTQERMGIDAEVAALLIARSFKIDIDEEIVMASEEILARSK